jgi:predicted dehydrogenase
MRIGFIGAGQFAGSFLSLFRLHPGVSGLAIADRVPERSESMRARFGIEEVFATDDELLASDVDAVAVFTQRWTHGPLVTKALDAGKHVYSAVPMAITLDEVDQIIDAVDRTGLVYMMGETSFYNPATVYARGRMAAGDFGRVFYSEGDYVHDMDLGFYDAYRYSGGDGWKTTASYPPLLYPTHSIGGVLGALPTSAVSVSALGVPDLRHDGVFDRSVSMFDNDVSNASALFGLEDGGMMRINEFRRVGYPQGRESRFRFYGTEGVFEQLMTTCLWHDRHDVIDVSDLIATHATLPADAPELDGVSPELREAFVSGFAAVHDTRRLPASFRGAPNGHEGSHQFLVDDFVRAVVDRAPVSVDARMAARFTAPGIVAHESMRRGGERLPIPLYERPPAP